MPLGRFFQFISPSACVLADDSGTLIPWHERLLILMTPQGYCCYTQAMSQEEESGKDELEPLKSVCARSLLPCIVDSSLYNESPRI